MQNKMSSNWRNDTGVRQTQGLVPLALPLAGTPGCSEHGPICHLFELILVIHANTSNGTNLIV
jgi:hypothetical protein